MSGGVWPSRDESDLTMRGTPSPAQHAARLAFEAELRELMQHGLTLRDEAEAAEFGRKAARLVAEEEQRRTG
jgi:hypothetical protein